MNDAGASVRDSVRARPHIHLFNSLAGVGGSQLRTIQLYRELSASADVQLWTQRRPAAAYADLPIRRLGVGPGEVPRGGTFIFVGVYWAPLGRWISQAAADRVVIVYNTFALAKLAYVLAQLRSAGLPTPELVYASAAVQRSVEEAEGAGTGSDRGEVRRIQDAIRNSIAPTSVIHPSALDIDIYAAIPRKPRHPNEALVVGRHSRDKPEKFHPDDPALFRQLADGGARVRLMGATCIADGLRSDSGVEVLAMGAEPPPAFLARLDVFLYRTSPTRWLEAFGRVILEAMASGLPCICENRGGHVEILEHGKNGFLFESNAEAVEIVARLRRDPALRSRIGAAARQTMLDLYSVDRRREYSAYYLRR